jgi:hypothetical protein
MWFCVVTCSRQCNVLRALCCSKLDHNAGRLLINFLRYCFKFPLVVGSRKGWGAKVLALRSPGRLNFLGICCSSARNLLLVTLLAPKTFRLLLDFWKICGSLHIGKVAAVYVMEAYGGVQV